MSDSAKEKKARRQGPQTTATLARAAPCAPLGAVLRVSSTTLPVAPYRLEVGRCTVGSADDCELVIPEETVSRNHLELALVPEGVAVRDLDSHNGTFYMGQRVERMVLGLGARLQLGEATLSIEADRDALRGNRSFEGDSYGDMIGIAQPMQQLFGQLSRLEGSLATVLVEGESGVGKELVAQALHHYSRVANGPIVVVNCGAIPSNLIASELFGHQKGAFTGAIADRRGAFEAADGGSLFLDEIGELPLQVQPMLLRALEAWEVQPLGSPQPRKVKVRVIAATNRDLQRELTEGRFREDLFYRLAVVTLRVPALRERTADVEALAQRFASELDIDPVPSEVLNQLRSRSWPGNVRELRNAIQVYAALGVIPETTRSKKATLGLALAEKVDLSSSYAAQKDELVEAFTRVYLTELLDHTRGNQTLAAQIAGLDRSYLGRLVHKHGLGKK